MIVHLIDGTYELFRHFYGNRRAKQGDRPLGAVAGVLGTVVQMLEGGATHIGVATDHVIESFRNDLWADYKTGAGIEPALLAQFHPLEEALIAMGVATWPMIELEADDALASAAHLAASGRGGAEGVDLDTRQRSRAVRRRRRAWCRWTGEVVRFATNRGSATSSVSRPHLSPTTSRWSATLQMAIRAFQGSDRKQPHDW